ncbi:hypothetical protein ACP70R_027641 [Stipagrostis hirtigluma subsp. patula]
MAQGGGREVDFVISSAPNPSTARGGGCSAQPRRRPPSTGHRRCPRREASTTSTLSAATCCCLQAHAQLIPRGFAVSSRLLPALISAVLSSLRHATAALRAAGAAAFTVADNALIERLARCGGAGVGSSGRGRRPEDALAASSAMRAARVPPNGFTFNFLRRACESLVRLARCRCEVLLPWAKDDGGSAVGARGGGQARGGAVRARRGAVQRQRRRQGGQGPPRGGGAVRAPRDAAAERRLLLHVAAWELLSRRHCRERDDRAEDNDDAASRFTVEWWALFVGKAASACVERGGHSDGDDTDLQLCSHARCGRRETRRHEFRQCSACGFANYCSRACPGN